jgi:hypothetical protein
MRGQPTKDDSIRTGTRCSIPTGGGTRDGIRIGLVEFQKLLLDFVPPALVMSRQR